MVKNKSFEAKTIFFGVSVILITVFLAWLVMAVSFDAVGFKVNLPAAGNNYSGGTGSAVVFNATFSNVSLNTAGANTMSNATFYYNTSMIVWQAVGNSTLCSITADGLSSSCSGPLNASQWANGSIVRDGVYAINATGYNGTTLTQQGVLDFSNLTNPIIIDNSEPSSANFTGLVSGNNHSTKGNSGNLTFNISVADDLAGISSVTFIIHNKTGSAVNRTYVATREGTSSYWSTSVNTSHYVNGNYNITALVVDTAGNFNKTANATVYAASSIVIDTIFDNEVPTVTVSCSPKTVNTGETVTCTCSTSTVTSGINSTSNPSPSTSNTGTFVHTCNVVSRSGVTASGTDTYTVEQGGTGSSSGGGPSGSSTQSWTTYPVSIVDFTAGHTRELSVNKRLQVEIDSENHYIGVKSVSASSAVIEVSSDPQEEAFNVGETKKFEVTGDDFYDLQVTLESITSGKAKVTVKSIQEEVPAGATTGTSTTGSSSSTGSSSANLGTTGWIIGVIVVIIVIVVIAYFVKKRK